MAAERAARLLVEHGGGTIAHGRTDAGAAPAPTPVRMPLELPDRVAGVAYERGATVRRLHQVGCSVEFDTGTDGHGVVVATPPSWRPDLVQPADLVEEVLRLEGYDTIPSVLPPAPPGRGLTPAQLRRRAVSRALAEAGYVEVLPFPFVGSRRSGTRSACPPTTSAAAPCRCSTRSTPTAPALSTTLLPGLLDTLVRNRARGFADLASCTPSSRSCCRTRSRSPMPDPDVADRPTDAEVAQIKAALPAQPVHVGVVLAGDRERAGLVGSGAAGPVGGRRSRSAGWSARGGRRAAGDDGRRCRRGTRAGVPRCASATGSSGTPASCTRRSSRRWISRRAPARWSSTSTRCRCATTARPRGSSPVPAGARWTSRSWRRRTSRPPSSTEALEIGGGDLLEEVRLFDVYTGEQVADGHRSLAFALRFRAPDRTLTNEEANAARDAAVAVAADRFGAALR